MIFDRRLCDLARRGIAVAGYLNSDLRGVRICRPQAAFRARSQQGRHARRSKLKCLALPAPTSVSLFDQGLTQVLQAAVTGLEPKQSYVLALSSDPSGRGTLESLTTFMTNPAGSAIVNAVGPIRQIVQNQQQAERRYLVIVQGTPQEHGAPEQVQTD